MNHCRDRYNDPVCLDCAGDRKDLANAVNASDHSLTCVLCGGKIPSITQEEKTEQVDFWKFISKGMVAVIIVYVVVYIIVTYFIHTH
jgi:hypothetical protein